MESKLYHIEPNTVQETLIIPLYGKKCCSERYPQFFIDASAMALCGRVDYDFSRLADNFMTRFGAVEAGMRVLDLVFEIKDYLKAHPAATVVNLGCGLDDLFSRVDNGTATGCNLDFPDVIALREVLLPPSEREVNLAVDLNDPRWMEQIPFDPEKGIVLAASGVFYYFKTEEIEALFSAMQKAFPGGRLVFDTGNRKALKLMLKTYIEGSDMKVGAFFCLDEPASMQSFLPGADISARGYMTGYQKLDASMPRLYRIMAVIGDRLYGLRIVRVGF